LRLLLDTHLWIWSQVAPEKLSARVARALENKANEV
jgi:PIN domain nuclease of toxin-antitoxin system